MASNSLQFIMIFASILLPSVVIAGKEYVVGDGKGWTIGFDYRAWTAGKQFFVGDKLAFNYPVGVDNVFKVNGSSFQNCVLPPRSEALTSGYDVITLTTPGRKWYICGVGKHCATGGQKLFITVQPQYVAPSPSPSVAPSPLSGC